MDLFKVSKYDFDQDFKISDPWFFAKSWACILAKREKYPQFLILCHNEHSNLVAFLMGLKKLLQGSSGSADASPYKFITISFDDQKVTPSKIPLIMLKTLSKKWIDKWSYVIEQRSDEVDRYYGYHVHILLNIRECKSKKKSEMIRELYNSVKKYVSGSNYIDIQPLRTEKDCDRVTAYMNGGKSDEKLGKTENDKPFRKEYGLLERYSGQNYDT